VLRESFRQSVLNEASKKASTFNSEKNKASPNIQEATRRTKDEAGSYWTRKIYIKAPNIHCSNCV
jgi:hypothetical protein